MYKYIYIRICIYNICICTYVCIYIYIYIYIYKIFIHGSWNDICNISIINSYGKGLLKAFFGVRYCHLFSVSTNIIESMVKF